MRQIPAGRVASASRRGLPRPRFSLPAALAVAALQFAVAPPAGAEVGDTERVSVSSSGTEGDGVSVDSSISADGRYVAFESAANNFVAFNPSTMDIFLRDTLTDTTTRVSVAPGNTGGNSDSANPSISADGRYVAFDSLATNLVAGDTNGRYDVFLRDTATNTTTRVSVASDGTEGDNDSLNPSMSADGRYVAFHSAAANLVPGDENIDRDIFVRDTVANTTTRVSVASDGTETSGDSDLPSISADGGHVAFFSFAENLVPDDTNAAVDVFVRDIAGNSTTRVSVATDGTEGDAHSLIPSISADGRYIAFDSLATNLVAGDTNAARDVFVRDTVGNTTTRISLSADDAQANGAASNPSISADARYVAFRSFASNLVFGDSNADFDIFVRDTVAETTTRVNESSGGAQANSSSARPAISADGSRVAFDSGATNLVAGDTNNFVDVFVHAFLNHPPVAAADAHSMNKDTVLSVAAPGVLGNDTDPDRDMLRTILVTGPATGDLALQASGSFSYTPTPGFTGTDTFTYKAADGPANSNVAMVTITVSDAVRIVDNGPCAGFAFGSRTPRSGGGMVVVGTHSADVLTGSGGNDIICALGGDDIAKGRGRHDLILGAGGSDNLRGGGGRDLIRGQGSNDVIVGDEGADELHGNAGHDTLKGGRWHDVLRGGDGKDTLGGGGGNDLLNGGRASDSCRGGPGRDRFVACE